jgi:hypothetical protein
MERELGRMVTSLETPIDMIPPTEPDDPMGTPWSSPTALATSSEAPYPPRELSLSPLQEGKHSYIVRVLQPAS